MSTENPTPEQATVNSWVRETFILFKTYLQAHISSFKREIAEEGEIISENTANKLKEDNSVNLKRVGNRFQFEFNKDIESSLVIKF